MIVLTNETGNNKDTMSDLMELTVFCKRKALFKLPHKYIKIYNKSMWGDMRTLCIVQCAEI